MRLFELRYTDQNIGGTFIVPSAVLTIDATPRGARIHLNGCSELFDNRAPEVLAEALSDSVPLHDLGDRLFVNLDRVVALVPQQSWSAPQGHWSTVAKVMLDDGSSLVCSRQSARDLADLLMLEPWRDESR